LRTCMPRRGRRRWAAVVVAAASSLAGAAPAAAAGQACAAGAVASSADAAALRGAMRCVVNAERARHGLRRLRRSRKLGDAARGHAADMIARGYFAHERPGSTLHGRLRAAGWRGAGAAEALGWGCGGLGAPQAVLADWLASPPHREIVLGPYTRAGIGLAFGAPFATDCPGGEMWVLNVGR
jgi:uncharacterized protein YkwD